MIRVILTGLLIFCLGSDVSLAASADNSFIIDANISGLDTNPPTAPSPLNGNAASFEQVNLNWQPAIDNIGVAGYVVYRDGLAVATTTSSSYVDTDVVPETSYVYHIVAFDAALNYGPDSNQVTVTTPSIPVPPPPSSGGSGISLVALRVSNFGVTTGNTTATINLVTNIPVRYYFSYGIGADMGAGTLASTDFHSTNSIKLTDLKPLTRYEYVLRAVDIHGREVELRSGYFITTGTEETTVPTNPSYFTARPSGNDVVLNWSNPDKYLVRVVRSHWFYPLDESEGVVIYEGYGQNFFDSGALQQYERQYYTIFFYNSLGQRSSGAVATASHVPMTPRPPTWQPQPSGTTTEAVIDEGEMATSTDTGTEAIENYLGGAHRVGVVQHDVISTLETAPVLHTHRDFAIVVRAEYMPDTLKTIMVTILDVEGEGSTYILTLNQESGYYDAHIPGVLVAGRRQVIFSLYDYGRQVVEEIKTTLDFIDAPVTESEGGGFSWGDFWSVWSKSLLILGVLFLSALLLWRFLLWRRQKDGEDVDDNDEMKGDIVIE